MIMSTAFVLSQKIIVLLLLSKYLTMIHEEYDVIYMMEWIDEELEKFGLWN